MRNYKWENYYNIKQCECGGRTDVHIPQIWNQPKGSPNFKCDKCGEKYLLGIDEEILKGWKGNCTITEEELVKC